MSWCTNYGLQKGSLPSNSSLQTNFQSLGLESNAYAKLTTAKEKIIEPSVFRMIKVPIEVWSLFCR